MSFEDEHGLTEKKGGLKSLIATKMFGKKKTKKLAKKASK